MHRTAGVPLSPEGLHQWDGAVTSEQSQPAFIIICHPHPRRIHVPAGVWEARPIIRGPGAVTSSALAWLADRHHPDIVILYTVHPVLVDVHLGFRHLARACFACLPCPCLYCLLLPHLAFMDLSSSSSSHPHQGSSTCNLPPWPFIAPPAANLRVTHQSGSGPSS